MSDSGFARPTVTIQTGVVDIFDVDALLAQIVLALGAALVLGNGYALFMERRGVKPANASGEIHRGRAWFLIGIGSLIGLWGLASLITS